MFSERKVKYLFMLDCSELCHWLKCWDGQFYHSFTKPVAYIKRPPSLGMAFSCVCTCGSGIPHAPHFKEALIKF